MKLSRIFSPETKAVSNFDRLPSFWDEFDRMFEEPFALIARPSGATRRGFPALDLYDDENNVYVKVEIPGMKKDDLNITLQENVLTLSGEVKNEYQSKENEPYRSERYFGRFERSVSLPQSVHEDKVNAEYKDGVLTITLPKSEESKPKKISVKVS